MTLIRYELKKLRGARVTLLIAALLIAAGLCFLTWQLTNRFETGSVVQQAQVFRSVQADAPEDMAEAVRDFRDRHLETLPSDTGIGEMEYLQQLVSYNTVLGDLEAISGYDGILEELIAGENSISDLMSRSQYRQRDVEAARSAYGQLTGLSLTPVFSGGIGVLLDQPVLDLILLLIAWCLVLSLFQSEYDRKTLAVIRITQNGILPTLGAKIGLLTVLLLLAALLLYGGGLAVVCWTTGSLPWGAPVQGIAALVQCPYRLNVTQFLLLFFALKICGALVLALLFAFLCVVWRSIVPATACLGAALGAEWLLARFISPFSAIGMLATVNLMRIWNCLPLFTRWQTANILDFPVPHWALLLMLLTVLALISSVGIVSAFSPPHSCEPGGALFSFSGKLSARRLRRGPKAHSIFSYEAKKLWQIQLCGLLLAALLLLSLFTCAGIHRWMLVEDYYYERYVGMLSGAPSAEKDAVIEQVEADLAEKDWLMALAAQRYANEEIDAEEYQALQDIYTVSQDQRDGWARAREEYERAVALREQGIDAVCVSQDGWELLFGTQGALDDLRQWLFLTVFLILGLSGYGAMEERSGMTPLLHLYPNRTRVVRAKRVNAAGYAALMALAAFTLRRCTVLDRYGLSLGAWPIQSIRILEENSWTLPVWMLFALKVAADLAVSILSAELLLALSVKLKNRIPALFAGAGILVLPVWILYVVLTVL